ncbi:MAG: potassium-transporting ATPase subunit KdpC, partial [Acinetobacter sp.]
MNTLLSHEQLNQQDLALSSQGHSVLRPSLGLIVVGFFIAGMLYATASVSIAQLIFPKQANGSVIELNGKIIGSSLVGQNFVSEQYFHGRPSAVSYNVDGMAGSNLAISNPDLQKQIKERTVQFAQNNHITEQHVPNEMVTASGSGIDPDISPESALLQVKRVAQQRHLPEQQVRDLVQQQIQPA